MGAPEGAPVAPGDGWLPASATKGSVPRREIGGRRRRSKRLLLAQAASVATACAGRWLGAARAPAGGRRPLGCPASGPSRPPTSSRRRSVTVPAGRPPACRARPGLRPPARRSPSRRTEALRRRKPDAIDRSGRGSSEIVELAPAMQFRRVSRLAADVPRMRRGDVCVLSPPRSMAEKLGCTAETIRRWVRPVDSSYFLACSDGC